VVHQAQVFAGARIEFWGAWTNHPQFGEQFKAVEVIEKKPASAADQAGNLITYADRGLNGQSQLIPAILDPGTYVVEVRTYYINDDTNQNVYNSGTYRLIVMMP
jgi:hypothetical protein